MDLAHLTGESGKLGDSAEAAFASSGDEINSQLAQLEAKELIEVEMALARVKQGLYGVCAGCEGKIPVARLSALPYSILCIACQREVEKDSTWLEDRLAAADFNRLSDATPERDHHLSDFRFDQLK
ncbi:MAG: TraR/DksA family transcriptional regulator [Fimbriiglobus sp.]